MVVSDFYLSIVGSNWSAMLDRKGESKKKKRGREAFVECLICSVPVTIFGICFIYI